MAHFAKLDSDNIVTQVIVINNEVLLDSEGNQDEQIGVDFCKSLYGLDTVWVQTSYNDSFRKQFAAIGAKYDSSKDKFIAVQPYPSWTLNANDDWEAPTPIPDDGVYDWNETNQSWDEITE